MLDLGNRVSIYQPEQAGLIFPDLPEFDRVEDERRHRKERLVAACRAFAQQGFDYGFAGHLTVRDPERPELYWTNPMCVHFDKVKMSNLILVDHAGKVIEGRHAVNRAGFVLHANVHEEHPDIIAMCHAHTLYGTAWCATGRPIEPITQDACAFFEDHVIIGDEAGAVEPEDRRIGGEPVGEGDPADERTPPTGGAATLFGDGERRADARRVGDFDPRRPEVRPENDRRTPPIISGASAPEPVRRRGQESVRTDVIGVVPSKFGGR